MGFLGVYFAVAGLGVKVPPSPRLKLVGNMLEKSNMAHTRTEVLSENILYFLVPRLSYFCWCQHFLATNQRFLAKIVPLLKTIVWELCYRCFSSVFSFCKAKGYCLWKYNYASGIWLLCFSKLVVNCKNNNDVKIFQHELSSNFFDVVLFLLSSLVAAPRFMSVSSLVLDILQFSFIRDWAKI